MRKSLLYALLIMAVTIILLMFNARGNTYITILPGVAITAARSIIFLGFMIIGVVTGILLK